MFEFLLYAALIGLALPVLSIIAAICYVIGSGLWVLWHLIRFKIEDIRMSLRR